MCACLLKAVCFAFDFVGEWRPTIQKKRLTIILTTLKMLWTSFV